MKKRIKLLIIILSCCLFCCTKHPEEKKQIPKFDKAVFVIHNYMKNSPVSVFKNIDFKTFSEFHVYSSRKRDTIVVEIEKFEEIYMSSEFSSKTELIISQGDSVFVQLKDSLLSYKIKKKQDYKIPNLSSNLLRQKIVIDKLEELFYSIDSTRPLLLQSTKYEKPNPIYPLNINRHALQYMGDSLKKIVLLKLNYIDSVSSFYDSLSYSKLLDFKLNRILKEKIEKTEFEDLLLLYNISHDKFILKKITSDQFINNSLINNNNKAIYLKTFIDKIVLKEKITYSSSKMYVDYKLAFDSLPNYFQNNLLTYSRIFCLNKMVEQKESFEDIIKYYGIFKEKHVDSVFINNFDIKILIDLKDIKNIKNDVLFLNLNSTKLSLDSLIKKNKGKLIYIDFWASWCAPCRTAMPASKKLQKEYVNKNIVFLYVSIDNNFSKWKKASDEEGLSFSENNILTLNYPDANFYKELKLKTIPRYLLYNKKGSLVHQNAPGPDTKEIKVLLNKYLKE